MTKRTDSLPSTPTVQVMERMFNLLEVLASREEPVSLKDISERTGLHPSTAHRILAAMTGCGFVERTDNGVYRLGIRLLELGSLVKSRISLRETAMHAMLELHQRTGESVNLGIRGGDQIVYVERTSSGRSAVRIVHIVGARAPLHTTATGKLFLAEDGVPKVREYAKRTHLPGLTPTSITTLEGLEKELDKVRGHSVAYDLDGVEHGVRCSVAADNEKQNRSCQTVGV